MRDSPSPDGRLSQTNVIEVRDKDSATSFQLSTHSYFLKI